MPRQKLTKPVQKNIRIGVGKISTITDTGNFSCTCDTVTVGVIDGIPMHSGSINWSAEEQIRWAKLNAQFFKGLSEKMGTYAIAVEAYAKTRAI